MKFVVEYEGKLYNCEWRNETNFEDLDNITGVSGFIFNEDNKLCIANFKDKPMWCLPGGGVEDYDETLEHAFIRETAEEVDLELDNIQRLGYMISYPQDKPEEIQCQVRFVSKIKKINEQTIDPAEGYIPERKFIHIDDFEEHLAWGENGQLQLKKALENLK